MDIGTAKVTKKEMKSIPHHLLDVASPKRKFTVAQFRKLALKVIEKIFKKGKIPILCGGTGFYIQAVIDGIMIPEVKPDWLLRSNLNKLETEELFNLLKKLDAKRAKTIEKENPRRLIRAIEIVMKTKKPVPPLKKNPLPYPVLMIGTKRSPQEIKKRIKKRFFNWLKRGLIREVKNLKKFGLSWKRIEDFGIHYRVMAQYLQKKLNRKEMIENSVREIENYAKRQRKFFKKIKKVHWVKNFKETRKLVKNFLSQNFL